MNGRTLYLEIGSIDDDLILEASEARGRKIRKFPVTRLAGLAACLCLICAAALFGMNRDVVRYNEAPAPLASKLLVPSDENTTVFALTYPELFGHYGLEPFPDALGGLQRLEQSRYYVYRTAENAVYDTNILNYRSGDGEQTLTILLSTGEPEDGGEEGLKKSRIDGLSVVLGAAEGPAQPVYWAELCDQGVFLRMAASGMDEDSFTDLIREIVPLLN